EDRRHAGVLAAARYSRERLVPLHEDPDLSRFQSEVDGADDERNTRLDGQRAELDAADGEVGGVPDAGVDDVGAGRERRGAAVEGAVLAGAEGQDHGLFT